MISLIDSIRFLKITVFCLNKICLKTDSILKMLWFIIYFFVTKLEMLKTTTRKQRHVKQHASQKLIKTTKNQPKRVIGKNR